MREMEDMYTRKISDLEYWKKKEAEEFEELRIR